MPRSCPHCGRETKAKSFLCGKCEMPHLAYLKQETGSPEELLLFEFFDAARERELHWYTTYKVDEEQGGYLMYFATDPITFLYHRYIDGTPISPRTQ